MKMNEYQDKAARTALTQLTRTHRVMHAMLGVVEEAGEIAGMLRKWQYHGKPLDFEELRLEIGDLMWFASDLVAAFGWRLEDIAQMNIDKLLQRYPHGIKGGRHDGT